MLRTFQKLPHRFGGRISGYLYYGAYVKVLLDADGRRATVTFFGGERVCHSKLDLERTVQKALRVWHANKVGNLPIKLVTK